jgi:hypothetical protein
MTTPPAALNGVEVDSEGLPWDSRIHSSSKVRLAKTGAWKCARGADPILVAQVKDELRKTMSAAPPAPVAPPVAPAPVADDASWPDPPNGPVTATLIAPAPAPAPAPTTINFPSFLQYYTAQEAAGKIVPDELIAIITRYGLPNAAMLASRPDLIIPIFTEMEALCLSR